MLLASGMPAADAAACAAWIHARAALIASAGGPITALDIADNLPLAIADMLAA